MIELLNTGAYLVNGIDIIPDTEEGRAELKARTGAVPCPADAAKETIAYGILKDHNVSGNMENLQIKFDKLTSHDITFVGIIQTARASGLEKFPVPYVLTNCHNSLCAVGGTINEDDHMFGLTCAKKYGGVYVPPHQAVIHQFAREMLAGGGKMILGSDSHTRYGALGTMAMGEGGPELVKQLLSKTYDIAMPGVIAIYMTGAPQPGVGPQDIALAIIGAVFANGYVKNKVMEFVGPGVSSLSADYRIGVDVMTTETTCLSSIWRTDEKISEFYQIHGRSADYKELNPGAVAYYDGVVKVELDKIKPMIAMPFHPSNVYTIEELKANLDDILNDVEKKAAISLDGKVPFTLKNKVHDGKLLVDQGIIAGCAGGGFENICDAADILKGHSIGDDAFTLSVYPASTPIYKNRILRTVLRRRRYSGKQCVLNPSLHQKLPEPRGIQDPERPDFFRCPDGCTFHCSNRSKQGIPDRSRRVHRNIHEAGIPLRQEDLREPCLRQQGCGRSVCRNPVRTEHQRLAGYAAACREPDSEGCFRDPRSGYDNRRADSIRRDFFLPFQPARTGRVHPVKKRSGLRGTCKRSTGRRESHPGRKLPGRGTSGTETGLRSHPYPVPGYRQDKRRCRIHHLRCKTGRRLCA